MCWTSKEDLTLDGKQDALIVTKLTSRLRAVIMNGGGPGGDISGSESHTVELSGESDGGVGEPSRDKGDGSIGWDGTSDGGGCND